LLEHEESRKISQTLELEQDQKERHKIQKEKYEVERKFQQQKDDLERKIREDKVEAEKKLTTIDARINKRKADCVCPTQVQSKDKWVECEEAHFEQRANIDIYSKNKSCICCST